MKLSGKIHKVGKFWAIEVPILGVFTQGRTKKEAFEMIADAVESLVAKEGFRVDVFPDSDGKFEIGSDDVSALTAFLLKRQRVKRGLSLDEVAKRLGAKSVNAYARYEQGRSVPTIIKLNELLAAVSPDTDFVLTESVVNRRPSVLLE
jgi:hypothetical protein